MGGDVLISEWLGYCARSIERGIPVQGSLAPSGWGTYIAATLPQSGDDYAAFELAETRVMRFLLAAAVAKAEGQ